MAEKFKKWATKAEQKASFTTAGLKNKLGGKSSKAAPSADPDAADAEGATTPRKIKTPPPYGAAAPSASQTAGDDTLAPPGQDETFESADEGMGSRCACVCVIALPDKGLSEKVRFHKTACRKVNGCEWRGLEGSIVRVG